MKDPTGFKTEQIRIFAADRIPFEAVGSAAIQGLREAFLFDSTDRSQPGLVNFSLGSVRTADRTAPINVELLEIGPRRIGLRVEGDSDAADAAYAAVAAWLSKQRPFSPEPLVLTEETSCTSILDIDYAQIFGAGFKRFIDESLARDLSHPFAAATFERFAVVLTVSYPVVEPSIKQQGVALLDKALYLEPRVFTPPSERRFFTNAPLRSDKHLELLSALERRLAVPKYPGP